MLKVNYKPLILLSILFIAVLLVGGVFVTTIFFITLFLILFSYISGRYTLKDLVNIVWKGDYKIQAGDTTKLSMELYNSGAFPIPYVKISTDLPKRLTGEEPRDNIYSILPSNKIVIQKEILCKYKGIYKIGFLEAEFGDILGMFKWKKSFSDDTLLYVYPKVYDIKGFSIPVRQHFGTAAVRHNAYEDYANIRDIRKYATGDSLKKVHWKVTAHKGELYVKNVELNATADLNIFLDLNQNNFQEENALDIEEKGAECAVSIIRYALLKGMSVSFTAKGKEFINLSGSDISRYNDFQDAVTQTTASGDMPIGALVKSQSPKLGWGVTAVIITSNMDKQSMDTLLTLKSSGIDMVVIYLNAGKIENDGNFQTLAQNDIRLYNLGLADDIRQVLGGYYEK